jgi:soluble lytic murein transglycosylase
MSLRLPVPARRPSARRVIGPSARRVIGPSARRVIGRRATPATGRRATPATSRGKRAPVRATAGGARRSRGRRRGLMLALGAVAAAVAIELLAPLAQRAIRDLWLPLAYQQIIRRQAAAKHLDPALVAAVIYAETKFDARTSPAGAEGLMQLEPATAEFLARRSGGVGFQVSDLNNPATNIAYGTYYLRYLLDQYHGNLVEALAAYNGGETNVDRWIAQARARGRRFAIADIRFPQTRAYVLRVLAAQREYRRTYPRQLGYGG